ncbi:MAG TPA: c-type cytochrome [Anaerolineales bacterium]
MKKFLKRLGITLSVLVLLVVLGGTVFYFASQRRLERIYKIPDEYVAVPVLPTALEYGKHIFQFRGCESCHGEKLEGKVYLSDPALGEVIATNLTGGKGGVGSTYDDADWVKTIRHGVRPNGKPLLFMPSTEFYFLSDEDLGAVIAYIKSMPPVDHEQPPSSLSITGRAAMAFVKFITFVPAELIPHNAPRPVAPRASVSVEYGEYLTYSCKVCHGLTMSGGRIPGFPEGWPSAANLTPSPDRYLPYWDKQGFIEIIRTGITRHERNINPQYMPWTSYKHMTDLELDAVWVYLNDLPPKPFGNR